MAEGAISAPPLSVSIRVNPLLNFLSQRLCVSAVIFLLTTIAITAQIRTGQGWIWQNPTPQGNPLYSILFAPDKEIGYAVGSDNTVLRTIDGGFRWVRQDIPFSDVTFSSVFVKDKNIAFVVGARGTIYMTDNAGKDWRRVATEVKDHFSSIKFTGADRKTGCITGLMSKLMCGLSEQIRDRLSRRGIDDCSLIHGRQKS